MNGPRKTRSGMIIEQKTTKVGRAARLVYYSRQKNPSTRKKKRVSKRKRGEKPSSSSEESSLDTESNMLSAATKSPSGRLMRLKRGHKVPCTHYGPDRRTLFPGYHFCMRCDYADTTRAPGMSHGNSKPTSRRNGCQADHKDPNYPTHRVKSWLPSTCQLSLADVSTTAYWADEDVNSNEDEIEEDLLLDTYNGDDSSFEDLEDTSDDESLSYDSDDLDNITYDQIDFCSTIARCNTLEEEVLKLRNCIVQYEAEIDSLQSERNHLAKTARDLHASNKKIMSKNANLSRKLRLFRPPNQDLSLKEHLTHYLDMGMCSHSQGRRSGTAGRTLAEIVMTYREGMGYNAVIRACMNEIRTTFLSPFQVARKMDLTGGVLNLHGLSILRSLQTKDKKNIRGTIIPSTHEMQKAFAEVERVGKELCPFTIDSLEDGEAVRFEYGKLLKVVFEAYGLSQVALEREVDISASIDGANLTRHLNHVMAGFKIKDKAAIDPLTKLPVFVGDQSTVQSRLHCFPLHLHMGRETKNKYLEFGSMFMFFKTYSGATSSHGLGPWRPFNLSVNSDMSAIWKGLDRGGGSGTRTYPCYCCPIHRDNQQLANPVKCNQWCRSRDNDLEYLNCYHQRMVTDVVLQEMEKEQETLRTTLMYRLDAVADSKMRREDPSGLEGNTGAKFDIKSIFFEPTTILDQIEFSTLLDNELCLRGEADPCGDLRSRRERLRTHLVQEYRLTTLQNEIACSKRPNTALFLLMQAIPCILHLENRVSLKVLTTLILEGIRNASSGEVIFSHMPSREDRLRAFVQSVEQEVNTQILGTFGSPAQWRLPFDFKKENLGPISLENWRSRLVMAKLERLIELSVTDENRKIQWNRSMPHFRTFMSIARSKQNWNTDVEMENFQLSVDKWFHDWVSLNPESAITNYIHMLAAGHICDYVFHWGNLYEHSQQGWEAFNSLLKSFYFRRTGHGGGIRRSRLKSIARWLQRRAVWLCGFNEDDIRKKLKEIDDAATVATSLDEGHVNLDEVDEDHGGDDSDEREGEDAGEIELMDVLDLLQLMQDEPTQA